MRKREHPQPRSTRAEHPSARRAATGRTTPPVGSTWRGRSC